MEATPFDLLAEARWEMEGTRRAAERYREAAAASDPGDLPSGQRLLREVIPKLEARITEMQLEAADRIASWGGRPIWEWPIQLLSADILAVITLRCSLRAARGESANVAAVPYIAREIASSVRDELEYQTWIAAQAATNKAAKEAHTPHRDVLAAMRARYPEVDRKVWRRWRRRVAAERSEKWDEAVSVSFGSALLKALCEAAPERFEIAAVRLDAGRKRNILRLSPETTQLMDDIEVRAEVARPMLMPMLIPPIPWRYE
jgi:hypothetical protein